MDDMTLIECEIVDGGGKVKLTRDLAEKFAALGRVRLPTPQADPRFAPAGKLPLSQTWQAGQFTPGTPVRW